MIDLRMPALRGGHLSLLRSGLQWLRRSGDVVQAREPVAVCHVRLLGSRDRDTPMPMAEEQRDLQVVLAPSAAGRIDYADGLSRGGYQDLEAKADWDEGRAIARIDTVDPRCEIVPLFLAGRRGFESGEGRGGLLSGWFERVRGSWEGAGGERFGSVLALGTCEQTGVFRGEDMAFLSWFARAPGAVQIAAVADERCVHSSAILLQHLRRTPAEARDITATVHEWLSERLASQGVASFPAFATAAADGVLGGRWPEGQNLLFALHVLAATVGSSPVLERSEVLTRRGITAVPAADAIALALGSEQPPHFRHKRNGWIVAFHAFRFGQSIGPDFIAWLRRDFEPMPRTLADIQRDLAALAREVAARTGGALLIQNLIASSATDRIVNYSWLGDSFNDSVTIQAAEANLMLSELTRMPNVSMIDSDAMAVDIGIKHCPDRAHASGQLLELQRQEVHHVLRSRNIPGF